MDFEMDWCSKFYEFIYKCKQQSISINGKKINFLKQSILSFY